MYDAIVVGGRCGGAATAMLLGRQGHKVLLIDQATFPSDVKLSTHLVWHAGVDLLSKWGLLDQVVAAGSPLLTEFLLDLGELVLRGQPPDTQVGAAIAPRRYALDHVLLQAAQSAGVEVRQGVTFEDVEQEQGRVTGIRGRLPDGSTFTAHGQVVIGADGHHSRVARAVGAQSYLSAPKEVCSHNMYAYFKGVRLDGVEFYSRPQRMVYAWTTNDGQVLAGLIQPAEGPKPERADLETAFYTELEPLVPDLARRLRAGQRESDWIGVATDTFCRQASGPGWALVGDAGMTVDPITAAGISNALRDAELLSGLIHEGLSQNTLDATLACYQDRRDAVGQPLWHFAQEMARLAPPTPEVMQLFGALAGNQPQIDRYFGLFGQTVSPSDFFSPENMGQIMAQARQAQPA